MCDPSVFSRVGCLLEQQASIPSNVPWDPAELRGHDCQHCACYFESTNPESPNQYQGFCRRWPADFAETRGQVPRLDPVTKLPMVKNGVPVMNNELIRGYLYKPTQREGTCYDGWRSKGTLPGSRPLDDQVKGFLLMLLSSCEAFPPELVASLRELLVGRQKT